jgi:hypothetical protein
MAVGCNAVSFGKSLEEHTASIFRVDKQSKKPKGAGGKLNFC